MNSSTIREINEGFESNDNVLLLDFEDHHQLHAIDCDDIADLDNDLVVLNTELEFRDIYLDVPGDELELDEERMHVHDCLDHLPVRPDRPLPPSGVWGSFAETARQAEALSRQIGIGLNRVFPSRYPRPGEPTTFNYAPDSVRGITDSMLRTTLRTKDLSFDVLDRIASTLGPRIRQWLPAAPAESRLAAAQGVIDAWVARHPEGDPQATRIAARTLYGAAQAEAIAHAPQRPPTDFGPYSAATAPTTESWLER